MLRYFVPLLGLALASAAVAQTTLSPAERFGVREHVQQVDLSPSGRRVLFLEPGSGRTTVAYVHDLDGGGTPRAIARSSGEPERLYNCRFVTDERLICSFGGMATVDGVLIPFSRLVSMDSDGGNVKQLGQRQSFYDARLRQFDGTIVDWLVGQDGMVLMSREYIPEAGRAGTRLARTSNGLGVDRIDVRTLQASRVEPPNRTASRYLSDGRGEIRIMATQGVRGATGMLESRVSYSYRPTGSRQWHPFGSYDSLTGEGMIPVAVDASADAAYILKKRSGRFALYRVKLDGSLAEELVFAHDRVDVDDVVRASRSSRVIGVTFSEDRRQVVYFDDEFAALAGMLGRTIPNLPLIDFAGASADGDRILIHAGGDSDPGRYYVYDKGTRHLTEILLTRPQLEDVPLASVQPVSYPAADGTSIPAYLTLPPGREGRNLPAVVLPHGGPSARDEWGFDWLAQYLAHLGYAVLQPNYRGSSGYGDQWLQQNGFQGWRTSIGDIVAGSRWLEAQGIADARRTAILGWSYGGYAALQAAATDPGLFSAVVAIAPVTDLQQLKDDFRDYTSGRTVAEFVGSGPHVAQGSPLRNAAAINAPVLLFHGNRDLNVPVIHSQRMDRALRDAGKSSELILFPGLEHDLGDSGARIQMLQRIGAFLDQHLAN